MKPRVRQVIVVEGRYDKNALLQVVDAVIVETGGFSVFHDREKLAYLRRLAATRGVILMTDPDGAGFVIRNHLKGVLPPEQILQAYVPDVYGKERRKRKGGKEGKLGVEGMPLPCCWKPCAAAAPHGRERRPRWPPCGLPRRICWKRD